MVVLTVCYPINLLTMIPLSNTLLLRFALVFVLTFGFAGLTISQTISGINPNSATAGQTINMIITGNNTNFSTATGSYLHNGNNYIFASSFTANSNTNLSATFNIPPSAMPGTYNVGVWPVAAAGAFSLLPSASGTWHYLSGKVIFDPNQNCIVDGGDSPGANKVVEVLPGPHYASTDANGEWGLWVPLGNYTVTTNIGNNQAFNCPATGSTAVNATVAGDSTNGVDFYYYTPPPPPFSNLRLDIWPDFYRPGFQASTVFKVTNTGNTPISGYTFTGSVPGSMFHLSESPAATNVVSTPQSHTSTWNIPALNPGQFVYLISNDSLPASIPLGTAFGLSGSISAGDDNANDNNRTWTSFVTGSYDPNDKQVWNDDGDQADGFIEPNDTILRYLIRCQNTGTDTAFNIYIRDTLDPNLDINTLQVVDASHAYQLSVSGPGYVQFTFPNVLLVDSTTNEPDSHGHIEYTIETKSNLPLGTQIDNTAHIYFDFNAPVVTNTVSSIICPEITAAYGTSVNGLTATLSDSSVGTIATYAWDFALL